MAGADSRLIGPGVKRLYPSGDLTSCTNGALLSAHQPAHSSQRKTSCSTTRALQSNVTSGSFSVALYMRKFPVYKNTECRNKKTPPFGEVSNVMCQCVVTIHSTLQHFLRNAVVLFILLAAFLEHDALKLVTPIVGEWNHGT